MEVKTNILDKVYIGVVALMSIINVIAYKYLPDKIGIHINGGGQMDKYIGKLGFVFLIPAVLIAFYIYSSLVKKEKSSAKLPILLILVGVEVFLLIMNL